MLSTRLLLLLPLFAKAQICTKVTSWAGANYEAALNKDGVTLTSDADLIAKMGTGDLNISRIQTSSNLRVSGARFTLSSSDSSKVTPAHGVSYEGDEAPIHRDVSPTSHVTGIGVMMISDDDSIPWVTSFDFFYSDGGQSGNMGNLIGDWNYVNLTAYDPSAYLLGLNTLDTQNDGGYIYAHQFIYGYEC